MDRPAINIESFLSANKSMITAPAGHGKTHTIVDCLEQYKYEGKKILILTHTHAGIASIIEKIVSRNIPSKYYEITTICSFALNITTSYIPERYFPDDSDMEKRYRAALLYSIQLLKAKPIESVMQARYAHIIIDEYQDCDITQHQLVETLAESVSVHILGDDMQGIFDFNGDAVNINGDMFREYHENSQKLTTPWRWINAGNIELGEDIIKIRSHLENALSVNLALFPSISYVPTNIGDLYAEESKIKSVIKKLLSKAYKENVLIIHPQSFRKESRIQILKRLYNLGMIESIDDKNYYETTNSLEINRDDTLIKSIIEFIKDTCVASNLGAWFHHDGTRINKRDVKNKIKKEALETASQNLIKAPSARNIVEYIKFIQQEFSCRIIRTDFYHTILNVLIQAYERKISCPESLKMNRDNARHIGRQLKGKCIGTTLLTKGLECHTVLILEADKFDSPKHFYVAISRACNKLIIAAPSPNLTPYPKEKGPKQKKNKQLSLFPELDV